jgi:hypothetical protein
MENLFKLLKKGPTSSYIAPIWTGHMIREEAVAYKNSLLYWLVGFWEVEGSFYIIEKEAEAEAGNDRYVHGIGLTQKEDRHV